MHQVRLEGLGSRPQRVASMAVTHSTRGLCGDRVSTWRDDIGWVVDVRTTNGKARRLYAWYARPDLPTA